MCKSIKSMRTGDLLVTKWQAPQLPTSSIQRPRLLEQMHQALTRQLVLLSAPAGSGKTTLLADWCASRTRRVAWLSLEPADNDPERFLWYLIAALQQVDPQIGETAAKQLDASHQPAQEAILTSILNDLATNISTDLILILDAYQVITHEAIHQAMTFVLEHLPPQVHLVIGTRMDPPWPLAQWRAQGRLWELHSSDLRFSLAEVTAFFGAVGLDLTEQMRYQIAQQTEGWIAGVQLFALAFQHEQAAATALLPSSHPEPQGFIVAYLGEEILAGQPKELQDFLMQTSILTRLNGPLCAAVTGRQDSQMLLERLYQANLFTEACDQEGGWYRYHPLFAEALRFHLERSHPELVAALHQRASTWYEQQERFEEAIDHALLIPDYQRVLTLLETTTAQSFFLQGAYTRLLHWLEQLPFSLLVTRPHLALLYAWMLVCDERVEQAQAVVHLIERCFQNEVQGDHEDSNVGPTIQTAGPSQEERESELTLLWATLALVRQDFSSAMRLATQVLQTAPRAHPFLQHFATLHVGLIAGAQGDLAGVEQAFHTACTPGPTEGWHFGHLTALSELVALYEARGELWKAARLYRDVQRQLTQRGQARTVLFGWIAVGRSRLLRERNALQEAARDAREALTMGQQANQVELILTSLMALARISAAQGKDEAAEMHLASLQWVLDHQVVPASQLREVLASRARLELARGKIESAACWAQEHSVFPPGGTMETQEVSWCGDPLVLARDALILVRLLLAQERCRRSGEHAHQALAILERLRQMTEQRHLTGLLIEILVLQALIHQIQGEIQEAVATVKQAVELSEPRGYVRVFVDEGEPMAQLLAKVQGQRSLASGYLQMLLDACLAGQTGQEATPQEHSFGEQQGLIEPLSPREREILPLMARGASNQEIAAQLVITLNTAKQHVKHILAKLAVANRTQAVARARELDLLSPPREIPLPITPKGHDSISKA